MSAWQPPRPSRLLWRVWYGLESGTTALEAVAAPFLRPARGDRPAGWPERAYLWWFDGPGMWVVRRAHRAERRWQRVRYARQTRRRRAR